MGGVGHANNQRHRLGGYAYHIYTTRGLDDTVFLDGVIKPVSDFGETKEQIWIPKDVNTLSLSDFGTNGFI